MRSINIRSLDLLNLFIIVYQVLRNAVHWYVCIGKASYPSNTGLYMSVIILHVFVTE